MAFADKTRLSTAMSKGPWTENHNPQIPGGKNIKGIAVVTSSKSVNPKITKNPMQKITKIKKSSRLILPLKKVPTIFLDKEKHSKTMPKKCKRDPKINPNPKFNFQVISSFSLGANNKIIQLKIEFKKKDNNKKEKRKMGQEANRKKKNNSVKATR